MVRKSGNGSRVRDGQPAMNEWIDAEIRAERALELSESQRWDEALTELDAALAINPEESDWLVQRARILDELERYEEAVEAYAEARRREIDSPELSTRLGVDLIRVGRYAEAVCLFEELAHERPEHEPAYCHRIAAYTRMGEHDLAEQMFYLAQQLNEGCPNCFHHLAESLACRGRFAHALYCWQRTLEIAP